MRNLYIGHARHQHGARRLGEIPAQFLDQALGGDGALHDVQQRLLVSREASVHVHQSYGYLSQYILNLRVSIAINDG